MLSVYKEPIIIKNFLSEQSCRYLINMAKSDMQPSTIEQGHVNLNIRYSFSYQVEDVPCNETVTEIIKGLLDHVDKNIKNLESPTITKYLPGGFYKPHFDNARGRTNRVYTIIICLNDDYEGGETEFPNLNKEYKLQKGDALFFHNYDTRKEPTNLSLHCGKTVKSGEKWICNIWIHDEDITPT